MAVADPHADFFAATAPGVDPPDVIKHLASAEAALMLLESMMLVLIEERVIDAGKLIEAIEVAVDTKHHFVAAGAHPEISRIAAGMLSAIANSVAAMRQPGIP